MGNSVARLIERERDGEKVLALDIQEEPSLQILQMRKIVRKQYRNFIPVFSITYETDSFKDITIKLN